MFIGLPDPRVNPFKRALISASSPRAAMKASASFFISHACSQIYLKTNCLSPELRTRRPESLAPPDPRTLSPLYRIGMNPGNLRGVQVLNSTGRCAESEGSETIIKAKTHT